MQVDLTSTGLGFILVGVPYVAVLMVISQYSSKKVSNIEDYLVAGRRLNLPLTTATLFATWFGAGTLMTVSDEVHSVGISAAIMDPFGAGICLLLAGFFFARGLWEAKVLTLPDLFRNKFNKSVEVLGALFMLPSYFGWIAVQYIALAQMIELFTGLPMSWGILLVALVGMTYTYMGGMWAVTLTDALQVVIVIFGLTYACVEIASILGVFHPEIGLDGVLAQIPTDRKSLFPNGDIKDFVDAMSLFVIGSLGNIPGQDLSQRICSANSSKTAVQSCLLSGVLYLVAGGMPVFLGLTASLLNIGPDSVSVVSSVVLALFSGPFLYVFFLVMLSVVLSTIDSATLSPAAIMGQNLLRYFPSKLSEISLTKISVILTTGISIAVAYIGESAYGLLEDAYEMQLVGLLAPLVVALHGKKINSTAMFYAMIVTAFLWTFHWVFGYDYLLGPFFERIFYIPISIFATVTCFVLYILFSKYLANREINSAAGSAS